MSADDGFFPFGDYSEDYGYPINNYSGDDVYEPMQDHQVSQNDQQLIIQPQQPQNQVPVQQPPQQMPPIAVTRDIIVNEIDVCIPHMLPFIPYPFISFHDSIEL